MLTSILVLLVLLQLKHLIVDWCWQPEYEWQNKGTYGHPGGIRHALKNAIGTGICFAFFVTNFYWVILVVVLDGLIHYHIDWIKMNLNKLWKLTPLHPDFYKLMGADQALHQITYILLVAIVFL
jgi:hypothetical protein